MLITKEYFTRERYPTHSIRNLTDFHRYSATTLRAVGRYHALSYLLELAVITRNWGCNCWCCVCACCCWWCWIWFRLSAKGWCGPPGDGSGGCCCWWCTAWCMPWWLCPGCAFGGCVAAMWCWWWWLVLHWGNMGCPTLMGPTPTATPTGLSFETPYLAILDGGLDPFLRYFVWWLTGGEKFRR